MKSKRLMADALSSKEAIIRSEREAEQDKRRGRQLLSENYVFMVHGGLENKNMRKGIRRLLVIASAFTNTYKQQAGKSNGSETNRRQDTAENLFATAITTAFTSSSTGTYTHAPTHTNSCLPESGRDRTNLWAHETR
eukprot:scpid4694/ scgid17767/ 